MTKLHEREPKAGDRFRLEDGKIVRFACLIPEELGADQRLITVNERGLTEHYSYPSGQYNPLHRCCYDIDCYYEEPKTVKAWVNIHKDGYISAFNSKEVANSETFSDRIACKKIEITYTPGEGLS